MSQNKPFIHTGDIESDSKFNLLNCKFGDYDIVVKVDENNQFIEVVEIKMDKIFYTSVNNKIHSIDYGKISED